jgi:uncharacterized protein DUF5681
VAGNFQNLRPWPKGVSGNPGGRPKKRLLTDELELLLEQEAPNSRNKTWAVVIAEALLRKAREGDVRAISELANRIEGKPLQAVELDVYSDKDPGERLSELIATVLKREKEHGT